MKSEKSRIFRSCNKTRWDKDKESKKVILDWPVLKMVKKVQKSLGLANHYR